MKFRRIIVFSSGLAVGYLAGSAAGRERFEQISQTVAGVAEAAVAAAVVVEAPADGAYGNLDSVVTGGGFTNQYAPATTASTTTAAASTLANPTHSIHDPTRATSERGGGGRSGKSDTMAP